MNVAISLFGIIPIYTFPLILGVGSAAGLAWSVWRVADLPKTARSWLDSGIIALAGALVGGRIGFVWLNWPYFQATPAEIPQFWLGGMTWWGAFAGSLIAIPFLARRSGTSTGDLADNLLPLMTSLVISTWLACWLTGHAYGAEVDAWWGVPAVDEWGIVIMRWPVQLVGALSGLGIHRLVEELRVRKWLPFSGLAANLQWIGISISILVLSPLRADPGPLWRGIRLDIWASLGLILLSCISILIHWAKKSASDTS